MAEYMTVENNIITGIYCGMAEEGSITLPDNHEIRVGEPLTFYNSDYTRKSDIQLMQEKLIEVPNGYKIENDKLVEMTYEEKIIAGLEALPSNMKIENGKLVKKSQDEIFNEMTLEQKGNFVRSKRDNLINEADILLLKYQEQVELGIVSENKNYYTALLQYKQALRDIPEQAGFPENVIWAEIPIYTNKE